MDVTVYMCNHLYLWYSLSGFYVPLFMCLLYYYVHIIMTSRLYIVSLSSLHGSPSHWCCFFFGLRPAAIPILPIRAGMTWIVTIYVCFHIYMYFWFSVYDHMYP